MAGCAVCLIAGTAVAQQGASHTVHAFTDSVWVRHRTDGPLAAIAEVQQDVLDAIQRGDTMAQMDGLYRLVKLNVEARHYAEADDLRLQLLELAAHHGRDTRMLAQAHNAVGSMYSRLSMPDSAAHHYRAGLAALDDDGPLVLRQALLGNLATSLAEMGQHDEADELHRASFALIDSTDAGARAWNLNTWAQSLMLARRYKEALHRLDEADSLNQRAGPFLDLAIDLAELRAECLDSLGDIAGAYAMTRRVRDLQDTLFEHSLDEQYLELEKRFGTRLKEEEIARLELEARERAERLRRRGQLVLATALLALLALAVVALLLRDRRRRHKYTADLERLNSELKDQQARIAEINRLLELKVLRARMDPHFIYNCITAIGGLVRKGESVAASAYLDGFARLLRMVLDHGVRDTVTIHEELDFLRQYLKLEAMRFAGGLSYSVDADAELLEEDGRIPSLLVQPFVENAIWHGLAPKADDRRVTVRFEEDGDGLRCVVEDNGVGRKAAQPRVHPDGSPSMGVRLSDERLQLIGHRLGREAIRYEDLHHPDGRPAGTRVVLCLA